MKGSSGSFGRQPAREGGVSDVGKGRFSQSHPSGARMMGAHGDGDGSHQPWGGPPHAVGPPHSMGSNVTSSAPLPGPFVKQWRGPDGGGRSPVVANTRGGSGGGGGSPASGRASTEHSDSAAVGSAWASRGGTMGPAMGPAAARGGWGGHDSVHGYPVGMPHAYATHPQYQRMVPYGYGYPHAYAGYPGAAAYGSQGPEPGAMRGQALAMQGHMYPHHQWPARFSHMAGFFDPRTQAGAYRQWQQAARYAAASGRGPQFIAVPPGPAGVHGQGPDASNASGAFAAAAGSPSASDDAASRSGSEHGAHHSTSGGRIGEAMLAALRPPVAGTVAHAAWQRRMIGGYTRAERTSRIMRWLHRRSKRPRPVRMKYAVRATFASARPRAKGRFLPMPDRTRAAKKRSKSVSTTGSNESDTPYQLPKPGKSDNKLAEQARSSEGSDEGEQVDVIGVSASKDNPSSASPPSGQAEPRPHPPVTTTAAEKGSVAAPRTRRRSSRR